MNTQIYKNGVVSYSADLGTFEAIQTSVAKSDVCTFESNVIGLPLSECKASISPVQSGSGDPYPAGGGANKQDEVFEVGAINSSGQETSSINNIRSKNYNPIGGSVTCYYYCGSNIATQIFYYDSNKDFISWEQKNNGTTLTTPANCAYFRIVMLSAYGTTYLHDVAINNPSTVTTYSPYANIRPISGWNSVKVSATGVNLWNEEWEKNAAYNNQGQKVVWANAIRNLSPIYVSPNTSYYLKFGTTNTVYVYWYDENMDFISIETCGSPKVITSPSNARYMNFNTNANYGTTYNNDISINYPSTDTAYHPFVGNPYTQYFGGLLNGTYGFVDLGTLNWVSTGDGRFKASISDIKVAPIRTLCLICTIYQPNLGSNPFLDKSIYNGSNEAGVIVYDSTYSGGTASAFTDAMDGVYLIYELATSITPTITQEQINTLMSAFGVDGESAIVVLPHTVYGAEHDVLSGVGDETWTRVDLSTLSYTRSASGLFTTTSLSNVIEKAPSASAPSPYIMCEIYNPISSNSITGPQGATPSPNYSMAENVGGILYFNCEDETDIDDFKTLMTGVYLYYRVKIGTETTYQATPAQLQARNGTNNVWSDAGQTSLKYYEIYGYSLDGLFETSTPNLSLTQNSINATDFIET